MPLHARTLQSSPVALLPAIYRRSLGGRVTAFASVFGGVTALGSCSLEQLGNGTRADVVEGGAREEGAVARIVESFATGQTALGEIVLGKDDVIWTSDDDVRRCSKSGPCEKPVTLDMSDELTGYVRLLDKSVFFSTGPTSGQGAVRYCDLPDGSYNVAVETGLGRVGDLAVDANETLFLHVEDRRVVACATGSDCKEKVVAKGVPVGGRIAIESTYVFWSAPPPDNAIYRALRSGGNASDAPLAPFATAQANALSLVVDAGRVVWANADDGSIRTCPTTGCVGAPRDIATGQTAPRGLVVDGKWAYWANSGSNTIVRCAIEACTIPELVAKDIDTPTALAIDETDIYVVSRGANAIVRIKK